jgi:diaminopimelate decarboxylase
MDPETPKQPRRPDELLEVVKLVGTPVYVYDRALIRKRIRQLRDHLRGVPMKLKYAMKANSAVPVLEIIRDEGLGIDAVSPAEVELALRVGFKPDQILFSANNMTDEEMFDGQARGVMLNIGELSRLERYGEAFPDSSVCVRINPEIGAGHHEHVITAGEKSKFGIPVERTEDILSTAERYGLRIVGLHQHIGSGILETDILWRAISVLIDAAGAFPDLEFINVGGGLGIPYRPDELPLELETWEADIVRPLTSLLGSLPASGTSIMFEPGRFLVSEAGTLVVCVNTIKKTRTRTFVGVDSGMGHLLRPALYNAYHSISNLSNPGGELQKYDVVGNICESADFFARDRAIQTIREGDLLAIQDTGAYGMSMSSFYNTRALPAEVFIDGDVDDPFVARTPMSSSELIDWLYPETRRSP